MPTTYNGTTGAYEGDIPAGVPGGVLLVQTYLQVGGSEDDSDPLIGTRPLGWSGTTVRQADFSVPYDSGFTVYGLVFDGGLAWNGTGFVDPTGQRSSCAIEQDYDSDTGTYDGFLPTGMPVGTYLVQSYLQLGGSEADSDPIIGFGEIDWPGAPLAPPTSGLFEQALASRLATDAVIVDLVADRISPAKLAQTIAVASGPAVTYRIARSSNEHNLDGPNGIVNAYVELRAFGLSYGDVRMLKEQFRQMFDGFKGLLSPVVKVIETSQQDDPDLYDFPDDGSDEGTHQDAAEYLFRYRVTLPTN